MRKKLRNHPRSRPLMQALPLPAWQTPHSGRGLHLNQHQQPCQPPQALRQHRRL
jgi:hypothetical protein